MVRRCAANSNYNYKIFFHPDQKLQAKLKSRENPVWFGVIRTPRKSVTIGKNCCPLLLQSFHTELINILINTPETWNRSNFPDRFLLWTQQPYFRVTIGSPLNFRRFSLVFRSNNGTAKPEFSFPLVTCPLINSNFQPKLKLHLRPFSTKEN